MAKSKSKTKTKKKTKKPQLSGTHVKLSFKRHVLPPLAGLIVAVAVFGFFNSQLLSARIEYFLYERNPKRSSSTVINTPVDKNAPPKLMINAINVTAPVIFDQTIVNEAAFQKALRSGVVHYPNTALPGNTGNIVIFGHSSGQWWAPGNYKFVFTLLDKVKQGDKIFIDYQGTRYIYKVYKTSVVEPTDLSVLNQGSKNNLTLLTCTPVGTSSRRLVVSAEQIVPKVEAGPSTTKAATLPTSAKGTLPSQSSSFWHDLKELF